jgi:Ni/Co efflux regulator RcnB
MNKHVLHIASLMLALSVAGVIAATAPVAATSDQKERDDGKNKVSSRERSRDHDRRDHDRRDNDRRDRDRRDGHRDGNRFKFNFELNLPRYYDDECFWETRTVFRNGRFTRIIVCVDNWN